MKIEEIFLPERGIASFIFLTVQFEIDKKIIRLSISENSQGKLKKYKDKKRKKNQKYREEDSSDRIGFFDYLVFAFPLNGLFIVTYTSHNK